MKFQKKQKEFTSSKPDSNRTELAFMSKKTNPPPPPPPKKKNK